MAPRGSILQIVTICLVHIKLVDPLRQFVASGISCPPMFEISYSYSSRTSSRNKFSPASSRCFNSSTRISGTAHRSFSQSLTTRLPNFLPHILQFSGQNRKPTCQFDFWRWVNNEVPACNLLYPSHFLTPEDMCTQHIAAQQHASAFIAVRVFTRLMWHQSSWRARIPRKCFLEGVAHTTVAGICRYLLLSPCGRTGNSVIQFARWQPFKRNHEAKFRFTLDRVLISDILSEL